MPRLHTRRTLCPRVATENGKFHAIERRIDARDTWAAPRFSRRRSGLRLPGMGIIHGFLQSIHASEI